MARENPTKPDIPSALSTEPDFFWRVTKELVNKGVNTGNAPWKLCAGLRPQNRYGAMQNSRAA